MKILSLSAINSFHFLIEILKILPPLLVLMALFEAWVPRELIESHLGKESGVKGIVLSVLLGTTAAGPLFAAFPIAQSLLKKGVRLSNIVIFMGAWSTIKIPMLMMESSVLGWDFTLWRFIITAPFIVLIGYTMERLNK